MPSSTDTSLPLTLPQPYHNVMLTNSSFPPTPAVFHQTQRASQTTTGSANPAGAPGKDPNIVPQDAPGGPPASAFLLPSFQYVPNIPTESTAVEAFLRGFVLPSRLHQTIRLEESEPG